MEEAESRIRETVKDLVDIWKSGLEEPTEVFYEDSEPCFGGKRWTCWIGDPSIAEPARFDFDPVEACRDPSYLRGELDSARASFEEALAVSDRA